MSGWLKNTLLAWPSARQCLLLGLAILVIVTMLAVVLHWRHFPSAPPGDGPFYWRVAGEQAIAFLAFRADSSLLLPLESHGLRFVQLLGVMVLAVGPLVSRSRLRLLFWLVCQKPHYLVVGDGGLAEQLAAAHAISNRQTVRLSPAGLWRADAKVVTGPLAEYRRGARAVETGLVDEDDLFNYRLATASPFPTLRHVHISHPALRRRLSAESGAETERPVLFGQGELLARMSLRRYPPNWIVQSAPLQLVIMGWGHGAAALLLALVRSSHFASAPRPEIRVLLSQANTARAEHDSEQAALQAEFPVQFEACDTSEPGSLLNALERGEAPSMLYLCHSDAADLLSAADAVNECQQADPKLAVPIQVMTAGQPMDVIGQLQHQTRHWPWFKVLALDMETVGGELTVQSLLDRLAIHIHSNYLNQRLASGEALGARPSVVPWDILPERFREENRAQADHHWIKLRDLGVEAVAEADGSSLEQDRLEELPDAWVEALAVAEHDRWVCSRLSFGWRYSPQRDDTRLLHPDLIPWEALDERIREYDRQAVRALPGIFEAAGFRLRPWRLSGKTPSTGALFPLVNSLLVAEVDPKALVLPLGGALPDVDPFTSVLLVRESPVVARALLDKRLVAENPGFQEICE